MVSSCYNHSVMHFVILPSLPMSLQISFKLQLTTRSLPWLLSLRVHVLDFRRLCVLRLMHFAPSPLIIVPADFRQAPANSRISAVVIMAGVGFRAWGLGFFNHL